jgi:hypothetical protein
MAPTAGRDAYPVGFKALAYALEIVAVIGETTRKRKYSANGILSLSCADPNLSQFYPEPRICGECEATFLRRFQPGLRNLNFPISCSGLIT